MATFPIKSDLTIAEQNKMDALLAITAAQRTTSQAAWLAARLPYQTNVVIKVGTDGNILAASGLTLPTGLEGFSKGATFTKTDATGNGLYMNTGDETSAVWDLIDEAATANIPDGAVTIPKLGANVVLNSGYDYYVDVNRTDTYTETGSIIAPFKTLTGAWTIIKAHALALSDKQKSNYVVHLAAGTYADDITLTTVKYIKFTGNGVTLSGAWLLDQTPIGGSAPESYTRVEFEGINGWRVEKGYGFTMSGNITLERSNDSLTYLCFKGVYVTGNILGDTKGTWVVQCDGSYINGSVTMTPTDATSCMLLETSGWARFNGTINGTITLAKCDSAEFSKAITITPIAAGGDLKVLNSTFAVSASIVGTKNLSIDNNSWKSLNALTPTLTGMTIIYLDDLVDLSVTTAKINALAVTDAKLASSLDLNAHILTNLHIEGGTPVNAVAAAGTLTVTGGGNDITDAMTVTFDTKTYTFKSALTPTEGEVLIGANDGATLLNLKNALNHAGTPDTDYSCAAQHPTIAGTSSNATTVVATARTKGVAGNAIDFAKSGASLSVDGTGFIGGTVAGVDGTVGNEREILVDATNLYLCTAANTIADSNWKKLILQSM